MRKDTSGKIWFVDHFQNAQVNEYFQNDGNLWRKKSTRTAVIVHPERYTGRWFYFSNRETVERQYFPKTVKINSKG